MIKKLGKTIDVRRFKGSMLDTDTLKALIKKYERLNGLIYKSPKCKRVSSCPVCGSGLRHLAQKIYKVPYYKCGKCGTLYTGKLPDMEEMRKYYERSRDYSRQSYSDKKTYEYRARETSLPKIKFVSGFIANSGKKWLDVGSGIGDVVYNLRKKGYDARGLEVSSESIKFSKKIFGLDLENKTIHDILEEEGPGSFDVISYFGVLEHIPEPMKQVSAAVKLLKPGGILVLEVPNADSFSVMADMFFPDSVVRHTIPAFHLMLLSEKGLLQMSKNFNLRPEAMWFLGLDFYNLILHLSVRIPGFIGSDVCGKLLEFNNELQSVFDARQMSDDIIFICRKGARNG